MVADNPADKLQARSRFRAWLLASLARHEVPAEGTARTHFLAKNFGVSTTAARKWLTGDASPDASRLVAMVDFFGRAGENEASYPAQQAAGTILKRTCLALIALLATAATFAEPRAPREPIDYIRCSSHMENAARGAYMLHSGFPAGADVAESAGAARRCAELAGEVLQREEQRTAFQRAHRIFLMAIEVPSMTAVTELSVALAQFNATLR